MKMIEGLESCGLFAQNSNSAVFEINGANFPDRPMRPASTPFSSCFIALRQLSILPCPPIIIPFPIEAITIVRMTFNGSGDRESRILFL